MTNCKSCVEFVRFLCRDLEDGGDFMDLVCCWGLMMRVQDGKIDGKKARWIMEERYGKDRVADAIRRAEEAGHIG